MKEKYYVTTAIAYTSAKPHIGNTYEIVLADLIARIKRKQGYDVFFQTGTDEHGEKIELKAEANGVTPKEYVDGVAKEIKRIWDLMDTSYDKFIRTTDDYHEKQVQKIFKKLYEQGDIYKGEYNGWYCTPCESFWTESQLVDGKCPDCGREVKMAKEEAYFFKMSKYADRLMKYYDENPNFITPISRKNELVNNFLKPGLQDLCVSRTSFKWGIPVDFDDRHVVYVWLDALTNYITGIGYDCDGNSSDTYKRYWPANLHIIGKDIIRFHCIYWPIFLMALGEELPKQIFGHPWLLQDGGKMSKSKGNVIYADDLVDFYGVDAVRYFLLSQMPFDNDGVINWDIVTDTVNGELANVYGNLVKRTIAMCNKYFGGVVENANVVEPVDEELITLCKSTKKKLEEKVDQFRIADGLSDVFTLLRRANKYIDETMPWALFNDERRHDRLKTVLYNLIETIVIATSLLEPFMPKSTAEILKQLGVEERSWEDLDKFGLIENGHKVTDKPEIVFNRLDNKEINEKVKAMYEARKPQESSKKVENVVKVEEISIDDFAKCKFLVGTVLTAEKVEKADKLLKMTIDDGERVRTVVSGIAKFYTAEEMVGKQVVLVANLKPAKLRGILSEGMILCAGTDDDLSIVAPIKKMPSGAEVR